MDASPERPARARLPRRDRIVILVSLAGLTLACWAYLFSMAAGMDMDGPAMPLGAMVMGIRPWSAGDFALMFAMWTVMMVGMMVPSAVPMTLIYARVVRGADGQGPPVGSVPAFVAGYVVMWTLFSAVATVAQWGLDRAALLSPAMVSSSPALGAALLAAAGVYQLTPYKHACLRRCRMPAYFIAEHWRPGARGALRMGWMHGAFCLGCCWALMGLLFLGGVMNLTWIAAITLFVLAEKVLPFGAVGGRAAGVVMILAGIVLGLRWLL